MHAVCSSQLRHSQLTSLPSRPACCLCAAHLAARLLLQSVVTYTAVGPTSNGKAVLANCQVRFELHSYTGNVACLLE